MDARYSKKEETVLQIVLWEKSATSWIKKWFRVWGTLRTNVSGGNSRQSLIRQDS